MVIDLPPGQCAGRALAPGRRNSYNGCVAQEMVLDGREPLRGRLRAWLPVAAWAALIFFLSTSAFGAQETSAWIEPILRWFLPSASAHTIEVMHYAVRKLAHFTEYGILFLLLIRGPMRGHTLLALGACAAYAMLDEGHQILVTDRTASLYDVALDCSGALFSHFLSNGVAELV